MIDRVQITEYFKNLQDSICHQLEQADGQGVFKEDLWNRPEGGGGRTRVIEGQHIIKGGVNFSSVFGELSSMAAKALKTEAGAFYATGVSIVLHPKNPWVPIIHMNVRYFELNNATWWFGGGIDLTPHYVHDGEARYFHQALKVVCDQHHSSYYSRFKEWADNYFYLKHRNETRGIGGIFFDRLSADADEGFTRDSRFEFVKGVGELFAPLYIHFLAKNKEKSYGAKELDWQMQRRGRYVEFNLVWDRGTKFGLETNGRTESILMSLPPIAHWGYNLKPQPNSLESDTLNKLKKGIDWISSNADQLKEITTED